MTLRNQVNRPTDKIDGSNVKDQVQFEFHVIVHQDICKDVINGLQGNDFGFLCKPLFLNRYKHCCKNIEISFLHMFSNFLSHLSVVTMMVT